MKKSFENLGNSKNGNIPEKGNESFREFLRNLKAEIGEEKFEDGENVGEGFKPSPTIIYDKKFETGERLNIEKISAGLNSSSKLERLKFDLSLNSGNTKTSEISVLASFAETGKSTLKFAGDIGKGILNLPGDLLKMAKGNFPESFGRI